MPLQFYEIDSSRMPLTLGSALRVPSYAYENWGIKGGEQLLRDQSERQYEIEWKGGSPRQMQNVVRAITESGLGNYSQTLRDVNAQLVSKRVQQLKGKVNYLELGAGVSTVNVYEQLIKDGVDVERVFGTLVEPSAERLDATGKKLQAMGLKKDKNFRLLETKDTDIGWIVNDNTQDVASYVAVLHHHADLYKPLSVVHNALRSGGILSIADWHNAMWEHPNRVYEFLRDEFNWPTKEEDLAAFVETYPKALETAPELSALNAGSNRNIKKFWKSWAAIRDRDITKGEFTSQDDIWLLEAHRPVERQNETLEQVGYKLATPEIESLQKENPKRLVDDAGILYETLAQKK